MMTGGLREWCTVVVGSVVHLKIMIMKMIIFIHKNDTLQIMVTMHMVAHGGSALERCNTARHVTPCYLCISVHGIAFHCTALHCIAVEWTALHCTVLHCSRMDCTSLYCTALQ